jgi:hypothetical protein
MAKRILLEAYSFTPASRTISITGRYLRREQLILITNVTTNTVIYNFADSSLTASAFTPSIVANNESTTIVLTYNTTSMSSTDKLSILIEEFNETFQLSEVLQDPIGKLRVSTPQSLIDTDFEYGVQQTKWETVGLMNNRLSAFYDYTAPIGIVSIIPTGGGSRVVTANIMNVNGSFTTTINTNIMTITSPNMVPLVGMQVLNSGGSSIVVGSIITSVSGPVGNVYTLTHSGTATVGTAYTMQLGYPITANTPVFIQDTTQSVANNWVIPNAAPTLNGSAPSAFTFYAREGIVATTNIYDITKTYMFVGAFYTGAGITVTAGTGDTTKGFTSTGTNVQCITTMPHGLTVGSAIFVVNSGNTSLTGSWFIKTVLNAITFTFDVLATPGTLTITPPGSGLVIATTAVAGALISAIVITTGSSYNVNDILSVPGGTNGFVKILATNSTGGITQVGVFAAGSGYTTSASVSSLTLTHSGSILFARSWGSSIHRPFDGGVQFGVGLPYHGNQLIRQTRRYFRYQSGKGISFNTGTNFCNPFQIDTITASGTTVTVVSKLPHNMGAGATIKVAGCDQGDYNGTFVVAATPNDLTFTYIALVAPSASPATGGPTGLNIIVQPFQWYGASLRIGMFDSQNGFFFQYDGQLVSAVRRSSTTQLSGYISTLLTGEQRCVGTGTKWAEQLIPGDFVVIRGQSYTVVSIESQVSMTIYPEYRGTSIWAPTLVVVSKTIDTKMPQSQWNIDKCDGTGSSGFNLDITKMQMWLMDYTWYGAGPIRWGFKNHRGEAMYAHRLAHGNALPEAYMRSGNLPARYEANTYWPYTRLTLPLSSVETTTITVTSTEGFPPAGTVCVQAAGTTTSAVTEFINYTGKTATTFTGLTRARTNLTGPGGLTGGGGLSTAQTFSLTNATATLPAGTAPVMVSVYAPQVASSISHWGSAVMMDGRYDDDKSFVFNYGMQTPVTYAITGVRYPVFSVRLSPSVDSGFTGLLGAREIINRMQLAPSSAGVYVTTAGVKVELFLNARVSNGTYSPVGGSSLAQYATHSTAATITGGECIFTFFAPANGFSSQDLIKLRDIGNSMFGGGNTPAVASTLNNTYPDGPDILTLCITPLAANAAVAARLNWTEAQA